MARVYDWARLDGYGGCDESDWRRNGIYRVSDDSARRWCERRFVAHILDGYPACTDWGGSSDQHRLAVYLAGTIGGVGRAIDTEAGISVGRGD